jgi:DNA-binding LacI/PurR family transcriptional regulator
MIDWLRKRGLPLVLVDQTPIPGVAAVNVDDQGGARLAAEHLLALGHRRIGIVTVGVTEPYGLQEAVTVEPLTQESYIARQRIRGWLGALSSAGVSPFGGETAQDAVPTGDRRVRRIDDVAGCRPGDHRCAVLRTQPHRLVHLRGQHPGYRRESMSITKR